MSESANCLHLSFQTRNRMSQSNSGRKATFGGWSLSGVCFLVWNPFSGKKKSIFNGQSEAK